MFDIYEVVFTLYGTGGSYDPDTGRITLLTNMNGDFVKYQNPAYTIIHEISHMGMEYSLVRRYEIPHGLKERMVDSFVYLMFQRDLPGYEIQDMGDKTLNNYLNQKKDIKTLDLIISNLMNK
ncbi:MAG: hypothetical protein AAGH46_08695 [Bacteroidota bacterium]